MAIYKRCKGGTCDEAKPFPSVKTGGKATIPADMVYQCVSNATTPCPPTGVTTCKCFVLLIHHGPKFLGADDEVKDEQHFHAAPDNTKTNPYDGMLTAADLQGKQIGRTTTPGAAKRQEYWDIGCRCLETAAGIPLEEVSLRITVPGGAYASTLREIEKEYGKKNVTLLQPAPEGVPASKRRSGQRKRGKRG